MAQAPLRIVPPMSTPYAQADFISLQGGLNDSIADELIEQNELSAVCNYTPDPENAGVLSKREGFSPVSTSQSEVFTSVHYGTNDIWATTKTKIINDAGTDQSQTLTSSDDPSWTTHHPKGYDIVANGSQVLKYDGSNWGSLGGVSQSAKYLSTYNNFVFIAGHSGGKVEWCAIGDPDTWNGSNWVMPGTARGLIPHRESNYFFTDLGWHQLRGFNELTMSVPYSGQPGTTSHRSLVSTPFGLFYWAEEGIMWKPDNTLSTENISRYRIPKTLSALNFDKFSLVHGVYNRLRQRVEFYTHNGSSNTHNIRIDYYPRIGVRDFNGVPVGSFWVNAGSGVQMAASGEVVVSGVPKIYMGSAAGGGYLSDQTGSDDNGSVIDSFMETRRESTEYGPESLKKIKMIVPTFILNGSSTVTVSVYLDEETAVTDSWDFNVQSSAGFLLDTDVLDTGVLGASADSAVPIRIPYREKFRKVKIRVSDSAAVRTRIQSILNRGILVAQ